MKTGKNALLICMLSGAGLLIALLYSPIGSPYNYTVSTRILNPGVYCGTQIKNAPTEMISAQFESNDSYFDSKNSIYEMNEPLIDLNTSASNKKIEIKVARHYDNRSLANTNITLQKNYKTENRNVNAATSAPTENRNFIGRNRTQNLSQSKQIGMGELAAGRIDRIRTTKLEDSNIEKTPESTYILTSDLTTIVTVIPTNNGSQTVISTNSGPQNAGDDDPGGGDDMGDPIPVSDGFLLLWILGIVYAAYKKKKNTALGVHYIKEVSH